MKTKEGIFFIYNNPIIGGHLMGDLFQVRVRANTCSLHAYAKHLDSECYGTYSKYAEDKSEIYTDDSVDLTNDA